MTYKQKLNKLLDDIFARSTYMTLAQFAVKAKLSVSCIWRLDQRKTELPRLKTIFLLARAVGMEVELVARVLNKAQVKGK